MVRLQSAHDKLPASASVLCLLSSLLGPASTRSSRHIERIRPLPVSPLPWRAVWRLTASSLVIGSMNRRSPACDAVIRHGAQDNTLVYLSLLPRELREEVDRRVRSVAWLCSGVPKRLDLPADLVRYLIPPFVRTVSSEGEPVLVCRATDRSHEAQWCHILRLNRPAGDARRIITLLGTLLGVDEGANAKLHRAADTHRDDCEVAPLTCCLQARLPSSCASRVTSRMCMTSTDVRSEPATLHHLLWHCCVRCLCHEVLGQTHTQTH